jgi:hypothetical protein
MGRENDGGRRGSTIGEFWGQSSCAGGGNLGEIHQFIKLYYFSADLQNEIKPFDTAIEQSIAEVLPGGLAGNVSVVLGIFPPKTTDMLTCWRCVADTTSRTPGLAAWLWYQQPPAPGYLIAMGWLTWHTKDFIPNT